MLIIIAQQHDYFEVSFEQVRKGLAKRNVISGTKRCSPRKGLNFVIVGVGEENKGRS
jgi:hypothetical protein